MNTLFVSLGYVFVALALFFLFGLLPPLARKFYPTQPGVLARAAAPLIFAGLAVACFAGVGLPSLVLLVIVGLVLRAKTSANRQKV